MGMDAYEEVDVAVVGGGFAGAMVAANWLARGAGPGRLALIERRMPPGRGVAYGTAEASHLLNIPASEMSAWPEDPGHFVRWLEGRGQAGAYQPRGLYGEYVEAALAEAAERASAGRGCLAIADEAIGCLPEGDRHRLRLRSGRLLLARQVVVAIGQFAPAPLRVASAVADRPWFVEDPWSQAAAAPLPGGAALLVGTGLTAIDVAVTLLDVAGAARVTMVSRRAQLPAAQYEGPAYADWLAVEQAPVRVSRLWRLVRSEVRQAAAAGVDWRAVVDATKPHVAALWARLPLVERRRFLRHARSHWEAARNRLPPPTAARVAALAAEGRLQVVAGRLSGLEETASGPRATVVRRGGEAEGLAVARVVNCTGPDAVYKRINHPLVLDLIGTGLARTDPLALGLDVAPDGRLKDEDGFATRPIYTLGWPRQGQLWEATTVPSLREQARAIALALLES